MSYYVICKKEDCIHRCVCEKKIKIDKCKAECEYYDNDASFLNKIGEKYKNIDKQ